MRRKSLMIGIALVGVLLLLGVGLSTPGTAEAAVSSGDACEPGYTSTARASLLNGDQTAGRAIPAAASGLSTARGTFQLPSIETDCVPMYLCVATPVSSYPGPIWIYKCHFIGWDCSG